MEELFYAEFMAEAKETKLKLEQADSIYEVESIINNLDDVMAKIILRLFVYQGENNDDLSENN